MGGDDRQGGRGRPAFRWPPPRSYWRRRVRGRTAGLSPEMGWRHPARRDAAQVGGTRSCLPHAGVAGRISHEGRMCRSTRDVGPTMGLGDHRSVAPVGRSEYQRVRHEAARDLNEDANPHGRLGRAIDERLMREVGEANEGASMMLAPFRYPYCAAARPSATNAIRPPRASTASRVMPFTPAAPRSAISRHSSPAFPDHRSSLDSRPQRIEPSGNHA